MHLSRGELPGFGPYRIDSQNRELLREGKKVPLGPNAFECLLLLLGHNLVTYERFAEEVWNETIVDSTRDSAIHKIQQTVGPLSKTIGKRPDGSLWIQNVQKSGYIFKAESPDRLIGTEFGNPSSREVAGAFYGKAESQGLDRRAFMRKTGAVVAVVAGGHVFSDYWKKYEFEKEVDEANFQHLFGIGVNQSGALIPAANHPFKKPPSGPYYPSEGDCCLAYKRRMWAGLELRTITGEQEIGDSDSLVLFGSQVSNLQTEQLLGNPFGLDYPLLELSKELLGWSTTLHWNLFSPVDAPSSNDSNF